MNSKKINWPQIYHVGNLCFATRPLNDSSSRKESGLTCSATRPKLPALDAEQSDEEIRSLVDSEGIRSVMEATSKNIVGGMFGALILAITIYLGMDGKNALPWVAVWYAYMAFFFLRAAWIARSYLRSPGKLDDGYRHARQMIINGVGAAIGWGSLVWLYLPNLTLGAQILLLVAQPMVLFAGAGSQADYLPIVRWFTWTLSAVVAIGCLLSGNLYFALYGVSMILVCIITNWFSDNQAKTLERQVRLRREMDRLRKEAVAARDEAHRANREKSLFLASASHDLRQPIAAIGTLVSLLQDKIQYPDVKRITDQLGVAVAAMENLVLGVLDLSRLDSDSFTPQFRAVNLAQLVEAIVANERHRATAKGLSLRFRCRQAWAWTDPAIVDRAARNLIANAIRYTQTGGILVAIRYRGENSVSLEVWDTGIGIAEEDRSRVFEAFYQADNPGRKREHGLGLGLSIAKNALVQIGSEIELGTKVGRGSHFRFALPRTDPVVEPVTTRSARGLPLVGHRIWLIEDDELLNNALTARLREWGAEVRTWHNADEVMPLLKAGARPDALLSDFRLPNGTVIPLLDLLSQQTGDLIQTIVMSGDVAIMKGALCNYSAITVLPKPFEMNELLDRLESSKAT